MNPQEAAGTRDKPRLLDQVRNTCRVRHLSIQTEKAYVHWIRRFIVYHGKRHPRELDSDDVRQFLTFLATELHVASSTQNQALCAIVFLYRYVIRKDIGDFSSFERARRPKRLPVVLSRNEVAKVLGELTGTDKLLAQLLYGAGLRLSEALKMRVKDLDLESRQVIVRSGKGDRDRITVLPATILTALKMHLAAVKAIHNNDLSQGFGETALPNALARKYPDAARSWGWQYVFPSTILSVDQRSGQLCRHHRSPATVQRSVKQAVRLSGIIHRAGLSYIQTQLRDTPDSIGLRYSHRSGASRTQECENNDGLHSCAQSRRSGCEESARSGLRNRAVSKCCHLKDS